MLTAAPAQAGSFVWNGSQSGDWSNGGNWSAGTPTPGADITLTNSGNAPTNENLLGAIFNSITIQSPAGYTVNVATPFTLQPTGLTANGTAAATGNQITLNGSVFFTTGAAASLTLQNSLVDGGVGTLLKTGAGTLTLGGASTYSGGTNIGANSGTISVTNASGLGTGAVQVGANSTLNVNGVTIANQLILNGSGVSAAGALTGSGTAGVSGLVSLASDATIGVAGAADSLTISGVISDTGSGHNLIKVGAGNLVLSGQNTYRGSITLSAGTITVGSNTALGQNVPFNTFGPLNMANGTTLSFLNTGDFLVRNNIAITGTASFTPPTGTFQTVQGLISDGTSAGTLKMLGPGTLALSNPNNTYTGGTTVTGGGLVFFANAGAFGSGNITLNGGGLEWGAATTIDISGRLNAIGSNGATFNINGNNIAFATALTGTGGVTVGTNFGVGATLTLTTVQGYSGPTTVNSGATLALSGNGSIVNSSAVTVNGTFDVSASATPFNLIKTLAGSGTVQLGGNSLVILAGSTEFSGSIKDTSFGGIEIAGGTQTLSGVNTYTNVTQIDAGATLALKGNGSIASSAYVSFTFAAFVGPSTFDISQVNTGTSVLGLFDPLGAGVISLGAKTLTITGGATTFYGLIQDGGLGGGTGGGLTIANTGSLRYGGVGLYTGLTTIASGGELDLFGLSSIATSRAVVNNGIFDISGNGNGSPLPIKSLAGTAATAVVNLGSNTLQITNGNDTYAGTITDSGLAGGLWIAGGKQTLLGASTFSGGTLVSNATLAIGNSAALGSGPLVLGPNGTLQFVQGGLNLPNAIGLAKGAGPIDTGGNVDVLSGVISGAGGITKIGSGALILTGANTYTGPTIVNGGILDVVGSIVDPTVNSGGTLMGTGSVGDTQVNAGGTLAPGNGTPGTSLMIAGNLAFQSGAIYLIQINPSTASFANVTGTATLGGATVDAVFAGGSYIQKRYTILTAAGDVSGTFAPNTINTNLPSNFHTTLSYDANNAYLNLVLNFAVPGGLNGNQQAVGNALTNFFNSNGSIPLVYGALTAAGLTQASGELATRSQQTTFDAMSQFINLLTDPFMGRGGGFGGATATPGYAEEDDQASAYAAQKKLAHERDAYAMFTKAPLARVYEPRWSVWASGFGGSQSTSGNAIVGSNDATSRIAGTAVGADYLLSPKTIAGFALAGGGTSFGVNNLGSGRSDLFQAGAYVRHSNGAAYITAALAYGWQDVTTDRNVTIAGIDHLRAEFNANAYSGRIEGGYRFVAPLAGGIGLTPYAAGQFITFDLPAYAETVVSGAPNFALNYAGKSVTDSRSELGIRTDKSFALANGMLTLRGRFAWAHDYDPNRAIAATFQALPGASFVVNGAAQARDSALTTASAEMKWLNGWSAAATFEGEFSNVTRSYAGKGVVRYVW